MVFNTVLELIKDLQKGKMVIILDDENRENEGDLVLPASFVTPEAINFMSMEARGLICVAITFEQANRLKLPLMVDPEKNLSPNKTAFTVSVESAKGISTGISSADRACTIKALANPLAKPEDIITPGHVFPIRAHKGGVLKRAGHTEASVDLCRLAKLKPSAVICEIINPDGSMARTLDLKKFSKKHGIKIGTIEDLIRHRITYESFVEEKALTMFANPNLAKAFEQKTEQQTEQALHPPPPQGQGLAQNHKQQTEEILHPPRYEGDSKWTLRVFEDKIHHQEHLVFSKGDISDGKPVLTRVHSSCVIGDIFGGPFSLSGVYLRRAIHCINQEGRGVLVYLCLPNQENRFTNQVKAYSQMTLKKAEAIPFTMDAKDYGVGAQILRALQVTQLRLLSNSPQKRVGLKGYGLEIVEMVPLTSPTK